MGRKGEKKECKGPGPIPGMRGVLTCMPREVPIESENLLPGERRGPIGQRTMVGDQFSKFSRGATITSSFCGCS